MDITVFNYTFHDVQWTGFGWEKIYDFLGIKDFIYFISSPSIQEAVFPIKLVFIFFTVVFFCAVIWFYYNSTYLQYKFLQDVSEFFSKEKYGLQKVSRNWNKIKKRADSGSESDFKLAIIEADDYLYETLQDMGYQGDTFEQLLENSDSKKILSNMDEILQAHTVRNSIVYEAGYALDISTAKRILSIYENAIKNLAAY